jgi:hypothetical protein
VDEQWVCPKCGFTNEYYAAYCVSCSELRPTEHAESPTPEQQTTRSSHQGDDVPASVTGEMRRFAEESAPRPRTSTAVPTPKSMTTSAPTPTPVPAPAPSSSTKRTAGRPRSLGKVPGLVILVIVVAIIIPAIRNAFNAVSTTDTTQQSGLTYPSATEVVSPAGLADIDTARRELLTAYQTKWQTWLREGQGDFPSSQYLAVDELLAFQAQVATVTAPDSAEARPLYSTWTTSLSRLLLAEQALAREPNQANLDARTQAWADEAAAYQPLYDRYLQGL